ncbi:hypothetical protein PINS_up023637 [Pythium insidiosum]|nr:hypothetical protein PINS_up023637 [Pythium insidiosum]
MVADSMLHPIDTINLRMKVQTQQTAEYSGILRSAMTIVRNEGIRGCFGGISTTMMASPVCASIYFGSYETIKSARAAARVREQRWRCLLPLGRLQRGHHLDPSACLPRSSSAVCSSGATRISRAAAPIRHTKNYKGTIHALGSILRSEGIRGLYTGYAACLSVDTFFSAFSFLFYETMKHGYRQYVAAREQHERSADGRRVAGARVAGRWLLGVHHEPAGRDDSAHHDAGQGEALSRAGGLLHEDGRAGGRRGAVEGARRAA